MARHDVSSPARATPASLFPNDFSSKNALEKLAQASAMEAAKRKKADDEAAELARLRTAYLTLEAQTKALESEKAPKDIQMAALRRQVGEMEHQLVQFRQDFDLMKIRLLETDNRINLDPSYHDRRVQIRLACWPHSALDLRGPHGWECDPISPSQVLRLHKVNLSDKASPWTIASVHGEQCYLGLNEMSPHKVETQRGRRLDGEYKGMLQQWWIGLNKLKTGYRCVFLGFNGCDDGPD